VKLILLGFAVWFAWLVHVSDWQWVYALKYDVNYTQVTIEKKPHDCEWSAAPIGEKNCHYERVISTVLTRPANIEFFPGGRTHRLASDPFEKPVITGGQMVSIDNWVTWHLVEPWNGPISPSVTVSWSKIND
jgi:hypothetical protein